MNNRLTGCRAAGYPLYAGRKPLPTSHFPPNLYYMRKGDCRPFKLVRWNKDNKKVGNLLNIMEVFFAKKYLFALH